VIDASLSVVGLPPLETPEARPEIGASEYADRIAALAARVEADRVVVYGDREHYANLAFFSGFDPRFEEALLVVGGERPVLLVGNEGLSYASIAPADVDVVLCPTLSLMGQDRYGGPRLPDALAQAGVMQGSSVGIVGWKALEPGEWEAPVAPIAAAGFVVDAIRHLVGTDGAVLDATAAVMNPVDGLRALNTADQIAAFEWAASRASHAIARIVAGTQPGLTELEAVSAMGYAGEPLSAHVMYSSGPQVAVGLRSATARRIELGDAATTAVGYWGGLSCRAGLVTSADELDAPAEAYLEQLAIPYWRAIATWYQTVRLGISGGEIDATIRDTLAGTGIGSALNPGHLTHLDEWVHSPIRPGSADPIVSGMALQCDIIPDNSREGWAANCEDTVVVADAALRDELEASHPDVWRRTAARQAFLRDQLGLEIADELLPLSTIPAYLPPFWLSPDSALVAG
jgi:Xaa-Pro aminopeptidase